MPIGQALFWTEDVMDVFKIHSWRSAASGSFQVVAIRDEDQDFEEAL